MITKEMVLDHIQKQKEKEEQFRKDNNYILMQEDGSCKVNPEAKLEIPNEILKECLVAFSDYEEKFLQTFSIGDEYTVISVEIRTPTLSEEEKLAGRLPYIAFQINFWSLLMAKSFDIVLTFELVSDRKLRLEKFDDIATRVNVLKKLLYEEAKKLGNLTYCQGLIGPNDVLSAIIPGKLHKVKPPVNEWYSINELYKNEL
jgi:hypothetical protein